MSEVEAALVGAACGVIVVLVLLGVRHFVRTYLPRRNYESCACVVSPADVILVDDVRVVMRCGRCGGVVR